MVLHLIWIWIHWGAEHASVTHLATKRPPPSLSVLPSRTPPKRLPVPPACLASGATAGPGFSCHGGHAARLGRGPHQRRPGPGC